MTNAPTLTNRPELFRRWLAGLDDDALREVLENRWDALHPLPPGIRPLAVRLQLKGSLFEAARQLNALEVAIVELLESRGGGLEPLDSPEIVRELRRIAKAHGYPTAGLKTQVDEALAHLQALALAFPVEGGYACVEHLVDLFPQGLRVLPDEPAYTPDQARALVDGLDERSRRIVETLMRSGGHGITKDAALDADPARPIPRLIAEGVLIRTGENSVRLPAGVRDALSGRHPAPLPLLPPHREAPESAPPGLAEAAAGTGLEMVRLMRGLIERLEAAPAALLKDRVLGVRTTTNLARDLGCTEAELARFVGLGLAAGLLSTGVPDPLPEADDYDDYLCPTTLVDEWSAAPLSAQWAWLLHFWMTKATMRPWLVGEPDDKGKAMHVLHPGTFSEGLPGVRRLLLSRLAALTSADAGILRQQVGFDAPLQASRLGAATYEQLIDEARFVGAIVGVHSTPILEAALASADGVQPSPELLALTEGLTPPTVDQLIFQADLTVLAPGPLPRDIQIMMGLAAEVESAGLASVFRLTDASISRALDAGCSEKDLLDFFGSHVLGELPQTVRYLIADASRRHGTLRGGPAMSYIRCEDEALLAEACSTPQAASVALRAIAPTVAIAQAPLGRVLDALREAGFHPSAEDATGASIDVRPPAARLSYKAPAAPTLRSTPQLVASALAAIRRADGDASTSEEATDYRHVFTDAIRKRRSLKVGYVDREGLRHYARITPIAVTGGQVSAADLETGAPVVFQLHFVTECAVI